MDNAPSRHGPVSILFVHDGENWIRGSERCMLDLVQHIDRRLFQAVVLCNTPIVAQAARATGAIVYTQSGWPEAGEHVLPSYQSYRVAKAIIDRHDVRLVHCNSALPIKALLVAARRRKIPLLAHLHIVHPTHTRLYLGLHQVGLAVGVSEAAIAGLRQDGMHPDRLRVIYNAVDPRRMEKGDARGLRGELGISEHAHVLVALGSLIYRKGVDVLIDAMALLKHTGLDIHLLVIGEGIERRSLTEQTARLGLQTRVHFLGEVQDVGAILRDAADIAVSAARQEAYPLNLLEASYCGLPVIASDIPPHREAIANGQIGMLAAPESAEYFAAKVAELVSAPDRASQMGASGAAKIREGHLMEHYIRAFESTYLELITRPKRSFGWFRGSSWPRAYTHWLSEALRRRVRSWKLAP